jgi:hypothetical protein
VHVQQARRPLERLAKCVDGRAIAALGEVRHRLEWPRHERSLGV